MVIRISQTNSSKSIDINKRYIYYSDHSGKEKIVCVLNPFFSKWTEEDERVLKVITEALERNLKPKGQ